MMILSFLLLMFLFTKSCLQLGGRMTDHRLCSRLIRECVEQTEIVDRPVVTDRRYFYSGFVQLASERFALVAKDVVLSDLYQSRRKLLQLVGVRAEWRC